MKTIIFAAHDPGGANLVDPIIELYSQFDKYAVVLSLLGPARERIRMNLPNVRYADLQCYDLPSFANEKSTYEEEVVKLFKKYKIDFTFTATSFNSNLEKLIIKHSKMQNIPSASIIDAWANYRERFLFDGKAFFPDIVFVTDEKMKREFAEIGSGSKIIISGNPHLQKLTEKYSALTSNKIKRTSKKKITFFSDNFRQYYPERKVDEFYEVEKILELLSDKNIDLDFLIKPHPMESVKPWQDFITMAMHKYRSSNIGLKIATGDFKDILADTYIAFGISTMALVEASICGIRAFSCQIDFQDEDYCYIPFEEYGIEKVLSLNDLSRVIFSDTPKKKVKVEYKRCLEIIKSSVNELISNIRNTAP